MPLVAEYFGTAMIGVRVTRRPLLEQLAEQPAGGSAGGASGYPSAHATLLHGVHVAQETGQPVEKASKSHGTFLSDLSGRGGAHH